MRKSNRHFKIGLSIIFFHLCFLVFYQGVFAQKSNFKELYPHWSISNTDAFKKLERIENFIQAFSGKGLIAIFGFDGTIVDEHIIPKGLVGFGVDSTKAQRALQPTWHVWAAFHQDELPVPLFPMFRTHNYKNPFNVDLVYRDDYLESKTEISVADYNKFTQIAILEAGMSPADMDFAVRQFLRDYPPETFVFFPMLDLLQRLVDTGFKVWIVTGSNPYFVATVLNRIEDTLNYTTNRKFDFGISKTPFRPSIDRIVGNSAKLLLSGSFSNVYDDRYVKKGSNGNHYVNRQGKRIAIEHFIEQRTPGRKAYFCAGNSGGDVAMLKYTIQRDGALGVAVNPRGDLVPIVQQHQDKIVHLKMSIDSYSSSN